MVVMNKDGDLFDERRKAKERRQKKADVSKERRIKERRIEDINAPKDQDENKK